MPGAQWALAIVTLAAGGLAFGTTPAMAVKPKVKILGAGQTAILDANALRAKVTVAQISRGVRSSVLLKGRSRTFDDWHDPPEPLTKQRRAVFRGGGVRVRRTTPYRYRPGGSPRLPGLVR